MCVNQKCMAVASLRANINKCPQDCNGNGVCNSLGHCHCREGFAPPFCNYPGPGGSEDSGPATDPNGNFMNNLISDQLLDFVSNAETNIGNSLIESPSQIILVL